MTGFDEHLEMIAAGCSDFEPIPTCEVCGEPSYWSPCIQCEEQTERDAKEQAFQRALNEMPADFVVSFNLIVSAYYERLADKKSVGENLELLCYFAKQAVKEKSKQLHS